MYGGIRIEDVRDVYELYGVRGGTGPERSNTHLGVDINELGTERELLILNEPILGYAMLKPEALDEPELTRRLPTI